MRRFCRNLLTFCAALSSLLCAFAVVASVFAYRDFAAGYGAMPGYTIFQPLEPPRRHIAADDLAYVQSPPTLDFAGFRIQRSYQARYDVQHGRVYVIPFWFLAIVYAVLPILWLRVRRRERREVRDTRLWKAGVCPRCGYDLRASPDRCPECGHAEAFPQ